MVPYWFLYALVPIYLVSAAQKDDRWVEPCPLEHLVGPVVSPPSAGHPLRSGPASWQSALTVTDAESDFVGGYLGYFPSGRPAGLAASPPGDAVGRDGGQLCRHRRRTLLAH